MEKGDVVSLEAAQGKPRKKRFLQATSCTGNQWPGGSSPGRRSVVNWGMAMLQTANILQQQATHPREVLNVPVGLLTDIAGAHFESGGGEDARTSFGIRAI